MTSMRAARLALALMFVVIPVDGANADEICYCAIAPAFEHPTDPSLYIYFGRRHEWDPATENCPDAFDYTYFPCSLSVCGFDEQECSGDSCGTCISLNGSVPASAFLKPIGLEWEEIGPEDADMRRHIPETIGEDMHPHRDRFSEPVDPKVVKLELGHMNLYAKIATFVYKPNERERLLVNYGIQVTSPAHPPATTTAWHPVLAPFSVAGPEGSERRLELPVPGAVIVESDGETYPVRIWNRLQIDAILTPSEQ